MKRRGSLNLFVLLIRLLFGDIGDLMQILEERRLTVMEREGGGWGLRGERAIHLRAHAHTKPEFVGK